jgi:gas vesicle protein
MRAVIVIVLIGVIGFFAYSYFTSLSEEEKSVKALDKEFDQAAGDFLRALRTLAGTGLDTTSDVDDAIRKIKKVKKELRTLMGTLKEDSAREMGQKLKEKIEEFERKNDIEEY